MDDVERVLALAAELDADPLMRRLRGEFHARLAAEESAVRSAEISRLRRLAPGHDPHWPEVCAGPVSLYERTDSRWRDCRQNWERPDTCVCGCGAADSPPVSRSELLAPELPPVQEDLFLGVLGGHLMGPW